MKTRLSLIFIIICSFGIFAQVGIGTTAPNTASALDVTATNKGILIPRVALFATNNPAPIAAPTNSLLVYNTNTANTGLLRVTPGFYYWQGGSWQSIHSGSDGNTLDQAYDQGGLGVGRIINATNGPVQIDNGRLEVTSNNDANGFGNNGAIEIANRLRIDGDEIITNNNTPLFIQFGNNGDLSIDSSSFYVDSSLNRVGVGTTTPISRFHVSGGRVEFTNTNDASGISGSGVLEIGNRLRIDSDEIITNNNTPLSLQSGNNGDLRVDGTTLYVDSSTNRVGVGTTTPVARFHVSGGRVEFTNTNDASGTSGTGVLEIGNALRIDGNEIITNTNTSLSLQNDNNGDLIVDGSTFRIDASTNRVGIGDPSPDAKLDVYTTANETAIVGISTLGHGASFRAANTGHAGGWWFCGGPIPCGNGTNFTGRTGVSTSGQGIGILGVANLDADASTDHTGGLFLTRNGNSIRAITAVAADVNGTVYKIVGHGTVSTLVNDTENNLRIMHAPETPEALFQDYGEGQLINGSAIIKIDPIFSNNIVVDNKHPLRVFIQLKGDCKGTYVTNETINGFEVKELQGGTSNVKFSWSITANRKDQIIAGKVSKYQDLRFERIKDGKFKPVETQEESE